MGALGNKSALANNGFFSNSDVNAVKAYMSALNSGVKPAKAWAQNMASATQECQSFVRTGYSQKKTIDQIATSMKNYSASANLMSIATNVANAALTSLAIALAAAAAAFVFKQIDEFIRREEIMAEKATAARSKIDELKSSLSDNTKTVNSIKQRYAELAQGVDKLGTAFQSQGNLNTEEYNEFLDISNQLSQLYPQLTQGYTENGDAILKLSGNINTIVGSLDALIDRSERLAAKQISEEMTDVWKDNIRLLEDYQDKLNGHYSSVGEMAEGGYEVEKVNGVIDKLEALVYIQSQMDENGFVWINEDDEEAVKKMQTAFWAIRDAGKEIEQTQFENYMRYDLNDSDITNIIRDVQDDMQIIEDEIEKISQETAQNLFTVLSYDTSYKKLDNYSKQIANAIIQSLDMENLPDGVENFDDLAEWYKKNVILALGRIDNKDIKKKIATLLSGEGTLDEAQSLYETIYNYLIAQPGFDANDPIILYIQSQLQEQRNTVKDAAQRLISNIEDEESRRRAKLNYTNFLSEQSDEFVNWVNNDLEIPDGVFYSTQELLDLYDEWIGKQEKLIESDPIPTIAKSVKDFSSDIKPWIDDLGNAYTSIFYGEDGFDIEAVNADLLEGIRSQFESIQQMFAEEYGIEEAFDTQALEKFLAVLSKDTTTVEEAQQAFNDYVTSLFYSAEGLKDLNKETADSIEQMMEQAGIINANEIVQERVNAQLEVQANREKALQAATEDANDTTMEATQKFLDEANMCNLAKIQLGNLVATETVFNNTTLNVEDRINKLAELANAYMGAAAKADFLNKVQNTAAGGHGTVDAATAWQQIVDQYSALEFKPAEFKPEDTSYGKGGAGDAGKEAADEYLEAFNAELENLDWLHENGKVIAVRYSNVA